MTGITRRTALKASAWSVPVIAVASTIPAAVASVVEPPATCGGPGDNGSYVVDGNRLIVSYRTAPDIYEVNARGEGWSRSYGTNYGTAPVNGSTTWEIELPFPPTWIQAHGFNAHFGVEC